MTQKRTRIIWSGDNLEILNEIKEGTVQLAYLDPPFGSGRAYDAFLSTTRKNSPIGTPTFDDRWKWDADSELFLATVKESTSRGHGEFLHDLVKILGRTKLTAYLLWLAPRLWLTHKTLAPYGSMYLHCDPKVSHYVKIIMDRIFEKGVFLNEIIWRRTFAHSSSKRYGPSHDVILFYSKGVNYIWNPEYRAYDEKYLKKYFTHKDSDGTYQLITCTAPGDRTGTKAHYEWRGILPPPGRHWAWKIDQMEKFESEGKLVHSSNGVPRLKKYVDEGKGVAVQDIWTDIQRLDAHSTERVGFDTQKPTELLHRIISASSNKGDLVLDPFCGSGTTLVAAERLGRDWVGIDQSLLACSLSLGRTRPEVGAKSIRLKGFPSTMKGALELRKTSPMEYGIWGLALTGCLPHRSLMTESLAIGKGQIQKRSLISVIPTEASPHIFPSIPEPMAQSTPLILCHEGRGDADSVLKWITNTFSKPPLRISLDSATSQRTQAVGIAPSLL